jgi:hypothetical protein
MIGTLPHFKKRTHSVDAVNRVKVFLITHIRRSPAEELISLPKNDNFYSKVSNNAERQLEKR